MHGLAHALPVIPAAACANQAGVFRHNAMTAQLLANFFNSSRESYPQQWITPIACVWKWPDIFQHMTNICAYRYKNTIGIAHRPTILSDPNSECGYVLFKPAEHPDEHRLTVNL